MTAMHVTSEPNILYLGTPVVLISTVNEDGSYNLAPMSSAFWLGWRCMLGLGTSSKTSQNILRTRECVLNLPSVDQVAGVNRLARTTGSNPVPEHKIQKGYYFEPDKFGISGFTIQDSETVSAPRVAECPIQLEAVLEGVYPYADMNADRQGHIPCLEVRIQRVHVEEALLIDEDSNRIDPDKWRPLIMSFQKFYGLDAGQLHVSTLAQIPETAYRSADIDRARAVPDKQKSAAD
jgi:flavin reductase (DIM6/NTAB) family NADH-FMN oxidoreductase RutF